MKTLLLDIETSPHKVYVWGLWDQNIPINQIQDTGSVLCWAAKWLDDKTIMYSSVNADYMEDMLREIWELLDEADIVVHYNGRKFDIPTLNKEFIRHGMKPPSPYKQLDLYHVVRSAFRFASNKLDYVLQALGLGAKVKHEGFMLWVKCMGGDKTAWAKMEKYNKGDVIGLNKLYKRLLPWIEKHPSHQAHKDVSCCPKCGSEKFQARGFAVTQLMKYRRYQCNGCGGWFRGNKNVSAMPKGSERMTNVIG